MKERKYRNAARSNLSYDRLLKETLAILLLLLNGRYNQYSVGIPENLDSTFQFEKGKE